MAKFNSNAMAAIQWDENFITLGALAQGAAVVSSSRIDDSRLQGYRVLRTDYFIQVKGMTAGNSAVVVGLAHDLSAGEIQEAIGADPQRSNDPTLSPRAMRPVWPLEIFAANAEGNKLVTKGTTNIGWSIPEGTLLEWFVVNMGDADLTTGTIVNILAKHFGVWLKD